ncbi:cysteine hydrolase [Emcibacter sp. SYSU 3D8]|uniref:cysteine hydrolase family protein n=1 Tax=Emcibacter sp. SYSU 3D8 TaxID=3133969 RepID=UPI0031FF3694
MGTDSGFGPPDERTVHLCIDMQRLFAPGGPWAAPWMDSVLPVAAGIAQRSPERTVFTRFIPPLEPEDMPGAWQHYYRRWRHITRDRLPARMLDLAPPLDRYVPPAAIVDKATYSAFGTPALDRLLQAKNVDGLIVTGAETDSCVLATVLGAVDRGYRVYLVTDAVCSSSDEGHDALMGLYRRRYSQQIQTLSAAEVIESWRL